MSAKFPKGGGEQDLFLARSLNNEHHCVFVFAFCLNMLNMP